MRYYISTSQQTLKDGVYQEYGGKETKGCGEEALIASKAALHEAYAAQLKSSTCVCWCGKVEDTEGNIIDKLTVGKYVDETAN